MQFHAALTVRLSDRVEHLSIPHHGYSSCSLFRDRYGPDIQRFHSAPSISLVQTRNHTRPASDYCGSQGQAPVPRCPRAVKPIFRFHHWLVDQGASSNSFLTSPSPTPDPGQHSSTFLTTCLPFFPMDWWLPCCPRSNRRSLLKPQTVARWRFCAQNDNIPSLAPP